VLETDGIDTSKKSNKDYLKARSNTTSQNTTLSIDFSTYIELRECMVGEEFLDSGK